MEEEALKDHDHNLVALLKRAREMNLKLNPKKLKLRFSEVPYLLTSSVKPDPDEVCAVQEMPNPDGRNRAEKVKAIQRFLWFVNYLSKFVTIWLMSVSHCDALQTRMQSGCERSITKMLSIVSSN